MSETLERQQYDTSNDTDNLAVDNEVPVIHDPLEPLLGHELRHGVDVRLSESAQRFREGVLDYEWLLQTAKGIAWERNNPDHVAEYAASALGKADSDSDWTMQVALIRKSIATLHAIAGDFATEHYGPDEHMLLKTVVAMCNLDESRDAQ